jgi:Domain of unknown function (DUF4524)
LGIFCSENSTVFIAISSNCEFVKIFDGDSSIIHLTRFCPLTSILHVKKLLSFRNQYANQPYLADRFNKSDSSVFLSSRTLRWASDLVNNQTDCNGWETARHADHSTAISICPFKKRLCYFSEATFIPDSAIGYFQDESMKSETRAVRHLTVLPLGAVPDCFLRIGSAVGSSTEELSLSHLTAIPSSIPNGATNSTSACDFFDEIEHELFVLKCSTRYPTSLGLAVRFESVDGDILLCSGSRTRLPDSGSSSDNTVENTVENWINPRKKQSSGNTRKENTDLLTFDLDSHMLANSDFGCNGGGPVLSLKGDYFTFYDPDPGLPSSGVTMHVSLLDCIDKEGIDEAFSSHALRAGAFDIRAILIRYRSNAIKLLEYREYLTPRNNALKKCNWIPQCLRPVKTTSCDNIPENIPRNILQNAPQDASYRIPRNPMPKSSEFHLLQGTDSTVCSRKFGETESVPYGGTYCVRMGQLHRVDSEGFDGVISDDRNASSKSSGGNNNSSSSSRDRYAPIFQFERDTVKLHSASGAKFTAYPFYSFQNPFSEQINTDDTRNNRNRSENYDEVLNGRKDGTGGQGVFSKVRGVFPDRTQIDLCLQRKVSDSARVSGSVFERNDPHT